jgi:phage/plasmid primase-like uncharacterized protein
MIENLVEAMENFGLVAESPRLDGVIHRCQCRGSRSDNGWYIGRFHAGHVYCTFGDWRSGDKETFTDNGIINTDETRLLWEQIINDVEKDRKKKEKAAREVVNHIMVQGVFAQDSHPYLTKKGVKVFGDMYIQFDNLLLPLKDSKGEITGGQTIGADGEKRYVVGTKKKGSCYVIPGNSSTICICEGYATGASIHEATGYKVLVAMDAGNLYEMASIIHKNDLFKNILICADNDHKALTNKGIDTAKKISTEFGFPYVFPFDVDGSDFNDLHNEQGLDFVRSAVIKGRGVEVYETHSNAALRDLDTILQPPGLIQTVADYYNATATKPQPIFGVAAGILLGSVVLGRRYRTRKNNFTSLYAVVAAKSGTGKDHLKGAIRAILKASNLEWLERAGGFTAANTVLKSLQNQPLQLSFSEEFGQRLQEAGNNRSLAKGTFRQLLDIFSSCHSYSVGDEYADGTVPRVERPALTMVGMTTPKALYSAINADLIEQGFVNRILPFISDAERSPTPITDKDEIPVPESIISWCRGVWFSEGGNLNGITNDLPGEKDEIIIDFEPDAFTLLDSIEGEIVTLSNTLERSGLDDLPTRNREITMRVSLIVAVMDGFSTIHKRHVEWSWILVKSLYEKYIQEIKRNVSGSEFEQWKLEALEDLRKRGVDGMRQRDMPKKTPWSKWDRKTRTELLEELRESGLADMVERRTGKRGPTRVMWVAIK